MKLCDIKLNEKSIITKINGNEKYIKRLKAIGITVGAIITPVIVTPLNDPTEYIVDSFVVAIRKVDACNIEVKRYYD